MPSAIASYIVYILRTSGNTLYVGQTNNLSKRLEEHRTKGRKASKYLKAFASFELVYTEAAANKSEALKREWQLKQLTKKQKEALLQTR